MRNDLKRKLIFDTAITGHHSEYIGHLIDYLYNAQIDDTDYFFVVNPKFSEAFPKIHEKARTINRLHWIKITYKELRKIQSSGKLWSSLIEFRTMHRYAKKYNIDHVFALDFHTIKYGGLFLRSSYSISTILFLQFHRMQRATQKQKIEFYKRFYITKWSLRNKCLERIFILNDQKTVDYLNTEFKTDIFKMLPDPIPELVPLKNFDIHKHYGIGKDRKIVLHIGALGHRKGTYEALESARHIAPSVQKRLTILLVGKAGSKEFQQLIEEGVTSIMKESKVQLIWDNQFVPKSMMKSLFDQCDVVLLPYKNAEFSSGILGHAAAANKRVIATGAGLIKELVMQHQLGELLEVPDAPHIAQKINEIMDKAPILAGKMDFVKRHSPKIFAQMILNT